KVREKDEIKEMKISALTEYLKKIAEKTMEEGHSYIIEGEKSDKSYEVFKGLIKEGYKGIVISDVLPKKIDEEYKIKKDIYWLSEVEGENILKPDRLDFEIMSIISNFLKENEKTVILLEGLEYLSQINGFDTCLRWLKTVNDVVAKNNGILILPINPAVFNEKEFSLLSQNMEIYEPREIAFLEINYTNIIKNIAPEGFLDLRTVLEPRRYIDYSERRPEIRYFVGREKEIKEINNFMKSESKILCIRGIAGIGKTTLVSRFLEGIEMNVFWHKCTEFTTLRSVITKISDFLSKIGQRRLENYLTGERFEIEEILILLEEELKGSKSILVFDDFHKVSEEILIFFSSFKNLDIDVKIIVIGREIPLFYDRGDVVIKKTIKEMVLGCLDKDSGIKLLKHREIKKEVERLYSLTKGHPLLLELVTPEATETVEEFIVEEVLGKLSEKERNALELASVFRHPFSGRAIIDGAAYETLDELVSKSLMQRSSEIYDLHDVIREVIYSRLSDAKKEQYHRLASGYYEKDKNLGAVIEAVYHLIKAHDNDSAANLAIEQGKKLIYSGLGKELLSALNYLDEEEVTKQNLIKVLILRGDIYEIVGEWDKALNNYQDSLKLSDAISDRQSKASSYLKLGVINFKNSLFDDALENLKKCIRVSKEINFIEGLAQGYLWLGRTCVFKGSEGGDKHLNDCIKYAKISNDYNTLCLAYRNLGIFYYNLDLYEKSRDMWTKSLELAERLENKCEIATMYNNLGCTYYELKEFDKALEYFEKCVKLGEEIGYIEIVGYGLEGISSTYTKTGKLDRAVEYLDKSTELFRKIKDEGMIAWNFIGYGKIYHYKKNYKKAIKYFTEGIKKLKKLRFLPRFATGYLEFAKMYVSKGDSKNARI
ncbi:MAG: tetratricopeptide repeat protein, partial [Candidatus Thermoplasmatota archaeon]